MMIDISEVFDDPDFLTAFQIRRSIGAFQDEGEWVSGSPTILERSGCIQPAKASDVINFLPEGERQKNSISIWSTNDILMGNGQDREGDIILHDGQEYKVQFSKAWQAYGYWWAIATGYVTNG